jgi:tRNA threonylcarbamoyladenosine biosynthesis protein TsaB
MCSCILRALAVCCWSWCRDNRPQIFKDFPGSTLSNRMLLLVTDTSGKHGSVALARAGEGADRSKVEVIEQAPLAGGTFSAQLVPQIAELLAKCGFGKADLGAFIVVSGPGSFTGLRVGLAAIKALAEILRKPIVPVSLLEAVALESGRPGMITAALDAGRGEVYVGEYEVVPPGTRLIHEQLLSKDEFLSGARKSWIATPDATLAAAARDAGVSVSPVESPRAETIAVAGWRRLSVGQSVSPDELEANYIRRSDAEIFAKSGS